VAEQRDAYTEAGGWGKPALSKKWHWFHDGSSVCGKWMFFGDASDRGPANYECCKACEKRLTPRKEEVARDA